jgi:hypothetical protein
LLSDSQRDVAKVDTEESSSDETHED